MWAAQNVSTGRILSHLNVRLMNTQPCVFIVDDDDAVRDGLGMVIETVGLTYQDYENAERFLEGYVPGTPGCLILGSNMTGTNGDELQAKLNRRNIQLPIIFLTSSVDKPTTGSTFKAGAVDYITKPVQITLMIERIRAALQHEIRK